MKLSKEDLSDLSCLCEDLKNTTLLSLREDKDNNALLLEITTIIVEFVTKGECDIYNIDYIDSLKREIRVQRKEIARLREERRMILNQDAPPNRGCDGI